MNFIKNKLILLLTVILLLTATSDILYGADIFKNAGTTGADFLKIVPFPRSSGMGQSFTSVENDLAGFYYNPATLATVGNYRGSFSHNIWFEDIAYDFIGGIYETDYGVFGAQGRYLYLSEGITETDLDASSLKPVPTGNKLSASDLLAGISYSKDFKDGLMSAGINLNYISRNLASYSASAFSTDLGFYWAPPYMDNMFKAGLSVLNLGTPINFGNSDESLPLQIRTGVSGAYNINSENSLLLSMDTVKPIDSGVRLSMGLEYSFKEMLFARTGYKIIGSGLDTISAGAGFRIKGIQLDYSWVPYGDYFSNTHHVGITFPVGEKRQGKLYGKLKPQKDPYSPSEGNQIFLTDLKLQKGTYLDSWEVWIEDKNSNLIRSWNGNEDNFPRRIVWDGKDSSGSKVENGKHYYFMRLVGKRDEIYFSPAGKFLVDNSPPEISINTEIDTFNPRDEELRFNIEGGDELSEIVSWKLNIAFKARNKLAKVIQEEDNLPSSVEWDGRDDYYGALVPDGVFIYRLYATDAAGNEGSSELGEFTVKVPPKVKVKKIKIKQTEKGLKIDLASKVLFGSGEVELKSESKDFMKNLAKALKAYPENNVLIEGHTDSVGSSSYNLKLSRQRAQSVADTLTEEYGIDPARLTIKGYGETMPIATNRSEEGRAKNRRVTVTILKAR